ncbi:DUF4012 domain-containing protein [Leifsonia sp. TF02-11]|uniref:DUF4012 domain-containing protein n=1 Tax=Leifsonia sp. TF02-11 TaxID=2815212 RepID=UPI001AA1D268|nr:DUF4012 domain-containing protein [Leifsonia sp. TF02-11]MBO1741177.1 DUF4012 domain-containing protein [Leifsonia sp. TF02-11]
MATGLSQHEAPPRLAAPPTEPRRRTWRRVLWIVLIVVLLVLAAAAWVGVRAALARQELAAAEPDVQAVRTAIESGGITHVGPAAADLQKRAHHAAALTSDPVWRLAEFVPWIGPNLTAVRMVAAATDTLASDVVRPLVSVAGAVDPQSLKPSGGKIDLKPLLTAQPVLERAQTSFESAQRQVAAIDDRSVVAPVAAAVDKVRSAMNAVGPDLTIAGNTARLLPGMLGATGPRSYLIVAQNPAELRSTGGLIGSVALVTTDHGAVTLTSQNAGTAIGPWSEPVVGVPTATTDLYGPLVGRYLQDVNFTPDFPLAARTASAMWVKMHGGVVDGVIALDPVVLSALLHATGPVPLPSGDVLSSSNAVPLLLSDIYARYPDQPGLQDAFFSSATTAVFSKFASGGVDGKSLVTALMTAGSSDRVRIWSSRPAEQSVLSRTTLAGELPASSPTTTALGVYFNDATGSKMDYYLQTSVAAGAAVCRADGKVTSVVHVTLKNNAPADAATALPAYVTGSGAFGVPPGSIRTRIAFYGPAKGLLAGVTSNGAELPSLAGTDKGRPVAVVEVQLAPGQSSAVDVEFLGALQKSTGLTVAVTPTLNGDGTTPDVGAGTSVGTIAAPCAAGVK